jgi:Fe-S cluster biogenesis protein NfuA
MISMSAESPGKTLQQRVEEAIDHVRPYIQADGGNIELVSIDDGVVKVRLKGACAGCPMSQMTLKMGVERHLREQVPEIHSVEAI